VYSSNWRDIFTRERFKPSALQTFTEFWWIVSVATNLISSLEKKFLKMP
jgi:hypothetical protein